ncbi:hypothetical protein EDD36DRAFT_317865 [Exophiala viscosa]|uniref:Uncharacterized protein n=1 Tax=Exophiala viscosa TaxID=2486360 RepID=A0AAN6DS36_9EURO|nr:hypothetical protein EDD36DRAFT_317865 [Exophiala viscosa]
MITHSSEIREARRNRRNAAGRSGGIFDRIEDGNSFSYQYAGPDSEPYRRESILAWESVQSWTPPADNGSSISTIPNETSITDEHEAQPQKDADTSTLEANNDLSTIPTKPVEISLPESNPTESETKSTKSNRASRAFKRMNQHVSEFVHRKAGSRDKKCVISMEEKLDGVLPSTPVRQVHEPKSASPFKEQMTLEADHESSHQEVNTEFFTPPLTNNAKSKSANAPDAEVFD